MDLRVLSSDSIILTMFVAKYRYGYRDFDSMEPREADGNSHGPRDRTSIHDEGKQCVHSGQRLAHRRPDTALPCCVSGHEAFPVRTRRTCRLPIALHRCIVSAQAPKPGASPLAPVATIARQAELRAATWSAQAREQASGAGRIPEGPAQASCYSIAGSNSRTPSESPRHRVSQ